MHRALSLLFTHFSKRNSVLLVGATLSLTLIEPVLKPAPASACFYWQDCSQERGQASGTRAGGKRTGLIRGGNDVAIPYVISPRNTWISEQTPPESIRWNPVLGSDRYTIKIWQWTYARNFPDEVIWETTIEAGTEVAFPELPLRLGRYYSVEVITAGGVSSDLDEGYYQAGFQLLSDEDYTMLRSQADELTAAEAAITEDVTLAQAGMYYLDELYADALQLLEPLTTDPNATDLVYAALGDTYSATGLNQLSVEAYEQAITLAEANERPLSKAIVLVNLSDVHVRRGDFNLAQANLEEALQIYTQLGVQPEISSLSQRLELFEQLGR